MSRSQRLAHDRGFAIVMTALVLLPLLVFASFGVDLASWYSRISFLQKSADAAALAGTVWMPDLDRATTEAKASLRSNGIIDEDEPSGLEGLQVDVSRGATATSLRVTVTDEKVTQFFSQVFHDGQALSRSAEAEYNLPLPLGSPLNYFGGDHTKTALPSEVVWSVSWPPDYTTRIPSNAPCNIGTSSAQRLGRWTDGPGFTDGHHGGSAGSGNRQCTWAPALEASTTRIEDHDVWPPDNMPCNTHGPNATVGGRWPGANNYQSNQRYSDGVPGNRQCVWSVVVPSSLPPNYTNSYPPANRPCNVPAVGRWRSSQGFEFGHRYSSGTNNRLCVWAPSLSSTNYTPPNPIDPTRSLGFWAAIGGPGDVAAFGDGFSARCTGSINCSGTPNQMYDSDGYWYVIKMPAAGATSTSVRIFDAAYNPNSSSTTYTGDTRGSFGGGNGFTTTYRVYRQTNPLDFESRTPLGSATPNQSPGSCHWGLRDQAAFALSWAELCSITPTGGETYLLNVKTSGDEDEDTDGVNGYALEAVAAGANQPAVYAFGSMAMRNNIASGEAKFYLAEVGPQYAGRTLVIELFDSGDATGNAYLRPVMPGSVAKDFTDIASSSCSYTASPDPNLGIRTGSPDGERTSPAVDSPTTPSLSNCRIQTTSSGTQRFNDEWLSIRVAIPADYDCDRGVNPEAVAGSCWWGIKYNFDASSNDVTTWQARIEGNPVHLTQ